MKGKSAELKELNVEVRNVKGAEHRIIYVNSSRMGVSPWDVRIIVGQVNEIDGGQANEDQATIIMSPEHAKAFLGSLEKALAAYENTFGEIRDPRLFSKQPEADQGKTRAEGKRPPKAKKAKASSPSES